MHAPVRERSTAHEGIVLQGTDRGNEYKIQKEVSAYDEVSTAAFPLSHFIV